ncbi:serine hydrolase [Paenibacillus sp. LHD-117]|uniref:serine hydrolase n=1 Tax=Paenibacillus sp. LHD-117 TaxID=3071412 RepID=UPI0027E090BA|nr:serine hydrolase [Paenibacillus sp. LHD-117]MDQ6423370.1 serine hydrolase [Paenibacillus sp. LHD-117]
MKLFNRLMKPSQWTKTLVMSSLAFSLLAPAAYAAPAETAAVPAAQTLNAENATKFLDEFFSSEQAKQLYVGASVVIVKDGETIAQRGYGYSDLESKQKVDPASSVFRIASVSKSFTATALMQLVEQGKVGLQDDFTKYVEDLAFDNPFDNPVTIEHLLTHTTGFEIRDPLPEDIHTDLDRVVELEDYVREHMPPVVREPGSSYMYDNFASMLQGLIVQNVSGMPFETYMDKQIFEPLGMDSSGFLLQGKLKDNLVSEYGPDNNKHELYAINPTVLPQGGMFATAEDVGEFMKAFLNGGATSQGRILAQATVDEMEKYRSSAHPLLPDTTYGFEAPMQLQGAGSSTEVITKAGDVIGTSSLLFMIPEQKTGVFLTYNKLGALRDLFYPAFISKFFPDIAKAAELDETFKPYSAKELERFSGVYADLRMRSIVSTLGPDAEGSLVISDAFLGPRNLKQVDDHLFVDSLTGKFTAFRTGAEGSEVYMKEPYLNPFGYAKKGEQPEGYADIPANHPYAAAVHALQSLGYIANDAEAEFGPNEAVTRGEFVRHVMEISGLKGSVADEPAFKDLKGHPAAAYVQQAFELGLVKGANAGEFKPDRAITRQEAAVMIWRALAPQYPAELFESVKLEGDTDDWAIPAVKMITKLGIMGPEVKVAENGAFDYFSKKALNRQEEAAILHALLTLPTDAIVASLMQQG